MGLWTIALYETPDARAALDKVFECATGTMPDPLCAVGERFHGRLSIKEWKFEQPHELVGPGGFFIRAKGRIVEVCHVLKYSGFTAQEEDGTLVLHAYQFLSRLVGSNEIIFMHELLPWDGADLDAISESLRDRIGPPAKDWDELRDSDLWEPGCWIRVRAEYGAE